MHLPLATRPAPPHSPPPGDASGEDRRGWSSVALFPLAVLLLAVGLGLGPTHLRREGVGVLGVLGALLLLAGLAGVAVTGWRVLRATRKRWWLLTVPTMLVVTYLVLWTVGQAVAASVVARPALGGASPADHGLAYEDVRFPASDGVELAGWYVAPRNGAAVVLRHGAGSTRTAVLDHAEVLASHGFGVLLVDARGHGESDGRAMDLGWWGERDTIGAVDFLAGQPGVEGIGVVGLSMGGEEAIAAAGVDPRILATVAEGATARSAADKEWLSAYGVRGEVQQAIDVVTFGVAGWLTSAPDPDPLLDAVRAAPPRPVLLVTAGAVEEERLAAERLRDASPGTVTVWTVPQAGHTDGLAVAPDEWEDRVVGFLEAALLEGGA